MLKAAGNAEKAFELKSGTTRTRRRSPSRSPTSGRRRCKAAGFKVKAIGVAGKVRRSHIPTRSAGTNMGQSPGGWCLDWPSGGIVPDVGPLGQTAEGHGWGKLSEKKLDADRKVSRR